MSPRAIPSLLSVALAIAASASSGAPAAGQSPSILSGLPSQGTLTVGRDHYGDLSATDATFLTPAANVWEEPPVDTWVLRGEPGLTLTIDLVSDAFDAQ